MKLVICSVFDRAAQAYGRPIFVNSVGVAHRSFSDEVNRSAADNEMFKHPDDFDLFQIGVFDDSDGTIEVVPLSLLVRAKDVKLPS